MKRKNWDPEKDGYWCISFCNEYEHFAPIPIRITTKDVTEFKKEVAHDIRTGNFFRTRQQCRDMIFLLRRMFMANILYQARNRTVRRIKKKTHDSN